MPARQHAAAAAAAVGHMPVQRHVPTAVAAAATRHTPTRGMPERPHVGAAAGAIRHMPARQHAGATACSHSRGQRRQQAHADDAPSNLPSQWLLP
eukprot:360247-Chlamydomonas_euryale.AAC.3